MKRWIPILVVLGMLLGGVLPVAAAGTGGQRTESGRYAGFSFPLLPDEYMGFRVNGWIGRCDQAAGAGCVRFFPTGQDRYVTIDIADASGQPVSYYAMQYMGNRVRGYGRPTCRARPRTLRVEPGFYLEIYVLPSGGGGCIVSPTSGTVTATFSPTREVDRS
ncbi:MAG TPA: hypothetical protein VNC78_01905 [Actinomycetota bacterium]|nr:hypothetical protein [Actinomycetota bacterium]